MAGRAREAEEGSRGWITVVVHEEDASESGVEGGPVPRVPRLRPPTPQPQFSCLQHPTPDTCTSVLLRATACHPHLTPSLRSLATQHPHLSSFACNDCAAHTKHSPTVLLMANTVPQTSCHQHPTPNALVQTSCVQRLRHLHQPSIRTLPCKRPRTSHHTVAQTSFACDRSRLGG